MHLVSLEMARLQGTTPRALVTVAEFHEARAKEVGRSPLRGGKRPVLSGADEAKKQQHLRVAVGIRNVALELANVLETK